MPLIKTGTYTTDYIYNLPEGQRAELIDGQVYDMAPPNRMHQELVMQLSAAINNHVKKKNGSCKVYPAPFAVFLNADAKNYVEPDISVICNKGKLDNKGCNGAPDWIIEIASPSTQQVDYGIKLFKYRTSGVREYWVVNPANKNVTVFDFEKEKDSAQYSFSEDIPVCIYEDLSIRIDALLNDMEE